MKTTIISAALVLLIAVDERIQAVAADREPTPIRAGDTVTVANDKARLKVVTTALMEISKGQRLNVVKVQGNRIWTAVDKNEQRKEGWVHIRDVVSQGRYKQFLSAIRISRFSTASSLGYNGLGLRSDGSVLVVNEWGNNPKGLYWDRRENSLGTPSAFSVGALYTDPENVIELPEGIYVTNNGGSGRLLLVPRSGGPPSLFTTSRITNPYGITIAPPGFESPKVKPGDLIVFDNGHGNRARWGVWAVDRQTGTAQRFAHGPDLTTGFLSGSFGPDGTLYATLNNSKSKEGLTIVTVSPTGSIEIVLANFVPAGAGNQVEQDHATDVATDPITGELFFDALGDIYAFTPGESSPRLIVGGDTKSDTGRRMAGFCGFSVGVKYGHSKTRLFGYGNEKLAEWNSPKSVHENFNCFQSFDAPSQHTGATYRRKCNRGRNILFRRYRLVG